MKKSLGLFALLLGLIMNPFTLNGFSESESDSKASGTLIVLNKSEASASLLDLSSGKEISRIETGAGPHEVAVSPDGKTAVVANYGARTSGSTLTVINIPEKRSVKTIDLKLYHRPHGIVYMTDGIHVVVTTEQEKKVIVVNVDSGEVTKSIDTASEVSHMVAVAQKTNTAFVANIGSGSVTVADLKEGKRLENIATGRGAEGIDISPDGKEVWVSNRSADTVSIIDANTLKVVGEVDCESFPIRVKFTVDGKHVLVSNARKGDVAVIDSKARKIIKRIPMAVTSVEKREGRLFSQFEGSPVPVGILVHPNGKHAYVANTNADVVTIIDLENWEIAGRLQAGKEPDGMGYSPLTLVQ